MWKPFAEIAKISKVKSKDILRNSR